MCNFHFNHKVHKLNVIWQTQSYWDHSKVDDDFNTFLQSINTDYKEFYAQKQLFNDLIYDSDCEEDDDDDVDDD